MKAAILAGVLALAFAAGLTVGRDATVPRCPEDASLAGVGSFEHGRWSQYRCGPTVDDYRP